MLKLNKAQADWAQEAASSKLRSGRSLKLQAASSKVVKRQADAEAAEDFSKAEDGSSY